VLRAAWEWSFGIAQAANHQRAFEGGYNVSASSEGFTEGLEIRGFCSLADDGGKATGQEDKALRARRRRAGLPSSDSMAVFRSGHPPGDQVSPLFHEIVDHPSNEGWHRDAIQVTCSLTARSQCIEASGPSFLARKIAIEPPFCSLVAFTGQT